MPYQFARIITLTAAAAFVLAQPPQKSRVAMFDFDNAAVQSGVTMSFMSVSTPNLGKASAAKIGRILGVDVIVLGAITHYDFDDKTTGGSGVRFGGFGGASMKTKHDLKAKVQISARLVSPNTAEVLGVSEGIGELLRKGVKVDVRDAGKMAMGAYGNNTIMNECMDKAIVQLSGELHPEAAAPRPRHRQSADARRHPPR